VETIKGALNGVKTIEENFWHLTNNVLMNATIAYVTA